MTGKGTGQGKAIIFGEHFVVHGAPAIAGGISNSAIVEVNEAVRNRILTEQKVIEEYSLAGISAVLSSMGIKESYDVALTGDLPTYGGLGSSAAFCVALDEGIGRGERLAPHQGPDQQACLRRREGVPWEPERNRQHDSHPWGVVEFTRGKTQADSKFLFLDIANLSIW